MKKFLFILILCSVYCLNAKTGISSNNPVPKSTVTNTQYPDYYQTVEARYLSGTNDWTSDGANGTIEISNNNLYVNFDPSWTYGQQITTGVIAYINIYPALPTIELGPIYGNGQETGYYAKIENNNLIVYTPNNYSGVYYTSLYFGISIDLNCAKTWYKDMDGDGFGDPNSIAFTDCYQPNYNYVDNSLDCNDQNHNIKQMLNWYMDADNDGYGNPLDQNPVASCQKPSFGNYASNNLDCDDANSTIKSTTVWYVDTDNDGFGDLDAEPITSCTKPTGNYATNKLDNCPTEPYPSNNGCQPTIDDMDENYIYVVSPTIPSTSIDALSTGEKTEEITYFDGLGRPIQKIGIAAGGDKEDIITHIEYDNFGRQHKEYLPYAETSDKGLIRTGDIALTTKNFYNTPKYENTTNPYSQKEFEASSLNRVLKQAAPGDDWKLGNGHEIRFDYQTNTDADQVRRFGVSFVGGSKENPYLEDNGIYDASQLYKTVTKDENWIINQTYPDDHTTQEYKDKQNRVVLKRTFDAEKWLDTYYVYDNYGNLTYVLPPKVFTYNSITQAYENNKSFYADNESSNNFDFFTNGNNSYCDINIYIHSNTITLDLYAYNFIPGSMLKSGKVIDLDFTPNLPNMPLANIMMKDAQGNPVSAGTAYIYDGDLYFNSTGVSVYSNSPGYYIGNFSMELTPYQANYTPPILDRSSFSDLIYQYKYDGRNRLIEKKLPGKEWEEIVYNKLDKPILTRDPNLKGQNKWLFTKYDVFGRVAYTGLINNSSSRSVLQSNADATTSQYVSKSTTSTTIVGTTIHYSNDTAVYPIANISELLSINYYDDYTFDKDGITLPQTSLGENIINYDNAAATQKLTKGLPTGTKIRVLDPVNPYWITTITGYDKNGRAIYSVKKNNYLFTNDILQSKLDFVGKVEKINATHTKKTSSGTVLMNVVTEDIFTYDQAGRLKKQTQVINGSSPEIIVDNTYDELGQLTSKKVGGKTSTGLQTVDYGYTIRGWLKSINNPTNSGTDLFGFGLYYNTVVVNQSNNYFNSIPLYNGNISSISWKTNNLNSNLKQYNYTYDALNRLKEGKYAENGIFNNHFSENIYRYDRNGNILQMMRNIPLSNSNSQTPGTVMDYLVYSYDSGNKLTKVDDPYSPTQYIDQGFFDGNKLGNDYSYDANGNMTKDLNKGIGSSTTNGITYNYLNLPTKITFPTGTIDYVYDATGVKQRKIVSTGITTDYAGGFQYENDVLKFFPQPEGYVEYSSGNFNYIYQYKDHLGNVRLSYSDLNSDGQVVASEIIAENNYYPFGLKHKENSNVITSTNPALKYMYNGKELQDENIGGGQQLNWYDYGARNYDPILGRWINIDPLAEKFQNLSPYIYALNNPLRFVDPDGKDPDDIILWGWDPALNKYRQTLVMKSNIYNINYYSKNIFAPMAPVSRAPIGPTYMYGLDAWATLAGKPDAVRFNISAQLHAGGVNVGGTLGVVAPLKGPDKGGLFFYGPSNEKGFDINFEKASYSLEIDGALGVSLIYKSDNNFKKFDRTSFEGLEASVGGNYGIFNASAFTASDKSYFGFSFGVGKSMGIFSDDNRGNTGFGLSGAKLIDYLTINPQMQN